MLWVSGLLCLSGCRFPRCSSLVVSSSSSSFFQRLGNVLVQCNFSEHAWQLRFLPLKCPCRIRGGGGAGGGRGGGGGYTQQIAGDPGPHCQACLSTNASGQGAGSTLGGSSERTSF